MKSIKKHLIKYHRDTYTNQDNLCLEEGMSYLDCALGINPFGCSELILENLRSWDKNLLVNYPQASKNLLREIINYWKETAALEEINIWLEAGTFGVIERLNKLIVDEKSLVLGYCPQFSDFMQDVLCCGGTFQYAALKTENNYRFNVQDLLSKLNPDFKLIYLDNPNNPTGQVIPLPEIETVVGEAQKLGIVVLIDEAYGDFMAKENSAIALVSRYDNLFVARSFTKGFGLAGLRVGYVVMSKPLVELYAKVAHPFPVNALGQFYAELALQDGEFLEVCQEKIRASKSEIIAACTKLRVLETDPSTPIMTITHPDPEVDLFKKFLEGYVLTTSGEHFVGLGKNSIRLRIPRDRGEIIIGVIKALETL